MPAIVEAEDSGLYVLKFRGAGQGLKALIAELVAGELARAMGLRVPELVFMQLDPVLGRSEPDGEIRELIKASGGLNLALDYLPGSITFDPVAGPPPAAEEASDIVCFDSYVTNVDRTPKNPNMLHWHKALWLIDHGASMYFHHSWAEYLERSRTPFAPIKDHVLLPWATALRASEATLRAKLTPRGAGAHGGADPGRVAGDGGGLPLEGSAPGGVPRVAARAPGGVPPVHRGGRACPRPARLITPSCAWCRAWSAGSSSTRASSSTA